jgi:ABC-type transport system involved in multi-copper enzyme maturation permease subunit
MKIASTSKFILKSLLSEKATGLFAVLIVIFLTLSLSVSDINIAVKYKLLEDALLASQSFIMTISAIFYAFLIMEKERKGGIFVFAFTSGCGRGKYLLSQFMALFTLLSLVFALFLIVDFGFLSAFAGGMDYKFLTRLLFSVLSAALLGFLTLSLSRFVSNTNSVIYAIFLFFIGSGADELMLYSSDKNSFLLESAAKVVYFAFPNFSFFDPSSISAIFDRELFAFLYFALYSIVLFVAAFFRFKKEVLRVG